MRFLAPFFAWIMAGRRGASDARTRRARGCAPSLRGRPLWEQYFFIIIIIIIIIIIYFFEFVF